MSRMNANIILAGQQPNIVNTLANSTRAAAIANQNQHQNALRQTYQQHGPGILSGDQNALNRLAQLDPREAFGIQQTHRQNARQDRRDALSEQEFAFRINQFKANASAAEVKAQAEEFKRTVFSASAAKTPEEWDAIVTQAGESELVGQFDNREALLRKYMTAAQILEADAPQEIKTKQDRHGVQRIVGGDRHGEALFPDVEDGDKPLNHENVQKLRKEFIGVPAVKDFSKQSQAYGRIVASAKDPSPAGDLAMIFNYMKVLDPGSVVRESEFATAANAAAWLQKSEEAGIVVPLPVARAIRKVADGTMLSDEQRADFVARGQALYAEAERGFDSIYNQYSGIAESQGFPVDQALIDFRFQKQAEQNQPDAPAEPSFEFQNDDQRKVFEKYSRP